MEPQHSWFVMKNPGKMDELGVPPILGNPHIGISSAAGTSVMRCP